MKKIIAFLLAFAGGSLLLCALTLAGCATRKIVFIYKSFTTEINEGNGTIYKVIPPFDSCSYAGHFTRVQLETTQLMAALPLPGNAAYANQFDTRYKNLEKITDIRIVPLYNYNAAYPAGSDISDSVSFWNNSVAEGSGIKKAELLEAINHNYNVFEAEPVKIFAFRPAVAPAGAALQQFALEFRTDKNAVLRDTTIAFFLKP